MKKLLHYLLACLICLTAAAPYLAAPRDLTLATTTSTKDSGLLDKVILPAFTKKTGINVKVISVGTGQALKYGETGDCDVVLVHARASEDAFVAAGYGVNRRDVMYNDFVLVGPADDPAGLRGKPLTEALRTLAAGKGTFISRGDNSGTHQKELELWAKIGITKPEGKWYLSVGKGMGATLLMAEEMRAYTLADRGTYASMRHELKLVIHVSGDPAMLNPYGVIAVNPARHPKVNYEGAMAFIEFITSAEGKRLINEYKVNGEQLFHAL